MTTNEHHTKPKFCHVCGYEVRVIHGRIARHFGRSYTGRRQMCIGSDELHRPRLESMDFRGLRRLT